MAATLSSFVTIFLDKLSAVIQEEVGMLSGVRSELEGLETKIKEIQCLLADAENRAFYSESIRLWLKELKEIMYDADDIIDDCKVAGEITASGQPEVPSSSVHMVRFPLSSSLSFLNNVMFKHKIGKRLESVNSRLEEISRERSQFQLTPIAAENRTRRLVGHQTSSLVVHTDITGAAIQMDSRKLIKTLFENSSSVDVIAITGMGGIGKTTLAQIVYNEVMITASFQMKMWVCVSKDFAEIKLLREIIACTGVDAGDVHTKEELELMVRILTQGKTILLVLDDIWSADVWGDLLRDPLQCAAAGSKVLITSRFEAVARQVGAVHLHRVEKMNITDGWALLCRKVSTNGLGGEMESLRDIGVKIIKRCGGLPLAIKVIGGVLRGRDKNREDWEEVLHSRTWSSSIFPEDMKDMVMEALHLSYEDLPPHLKQCFLYLSLFPEDHVFNRSSVVEQWVAEGFVKIEGDSSALEATGREYFKELVDRSLLQPQLAAIEGAECRMHDLLRSLAQFLAEDENFFGGTSELKDVSLKLRRLSMAGGDAMMDLDALKSKQCLRTLFLRKNSQGGLVLRHDVVETLGHLRVLDLSETGIEELPNCITKLRHLRYLDVSGTAIRELPECIADLRSLQFLLLNNCRNVRALPNGITKLVNLRSLEVYRGTEIEQMPKGIAGMSQLRNLKDFVVDRHEGALEELGHLVNLRILTISKFERVSGQAQARSAALENKTSLLYLGLEYTLPIVVACDEEMKRRMVDVCDGLRPPPSLQILNIVGYMGHTFPHWMWPSTPSSVSPIHNLTFLVLNCCMNFSQLPPLGLLPHLNHLWIKGAFAVTSIIPEPQNPALPTHSSPPILPPSSSTYPSDATVLFPMLEKLSLLNMPNLEKLWDWRGDGNGETNVMAFPRLQSLYVEDCPKLRRLPDCPLSGLKFLHVEGCPGLVEVGNLRAPESTLIHDSRSEALPPWLGQVSVDPRDDVAFLLLKVRSCLLKRLLRQKEEDRPDNPQGDWHVIKRFPRVYVEATDEASAFFAYIKNPLFFNTNVQITRSEDSEERESKRRRAE